MTNSTSIGSGLWDLYFQSRQNWKILEFCRPIYWQIPDAILVKFQVLPKPKRVHRLHLNFDFRHFQAASNQANRLANKFGGGIFPTILGAMVVKLLFG